MKYLFADNFRGFTKTYIPLDDVNFLVGENSTGKTSILGLIKLLSSPMFLARLNFDIDEIKFGHFKDIVSVHSDNRDYFSIGFIGEYINGSNKRKGNRRAFLMTFREEKGMPRIYRYSYIFEDKTISIEYTDEIRYSYSANPILANDKEFIKHIYSKWITAHHKKHKNYKVLSSEEMPSYFKSLIMPTALLIENEILGKKTSAPHYTFAYEDPFGIIAWLAPIRSKPRRTYDEYSLDYSPEGSHTPYLIKEILSKKNISKRFKTFLKKYGSSSGLFETVSIKSYGQDDISPFELDVQIKNKMLSVNNVGYGVSQSLPVIVELFAQPKKTWFAIQQPEVHLHPKAQAALGDMFYELSDKEDKKFVIETHSDFAIDRFRLNYGKRKSSKKPGEVLSISV